MNIAVSIVEDQKQTREILGEWLREAEGFNCVGLHGSIESALSKLPAEKPAVVLMDINLPGLSGIEGVRQLKVLLPKTQFIMFTVYDDANHVFDSLAAGASGYMLKRTPRTDLLDSLKDVYNGGSPMTSSIARKVVQTFQRNDPVPASSSPEHASSNNLSPREREVLELLARGYLYKEIVESLKICLPTVNTHVRHIYEKLHVRSRSQAVAKFSNFSLSHPGNYPARD